MDRMDLPLFHGLSFAGVFRLGMLIRAGGYRYARGCRCGRVLVFHDVLQFRLTGFDWFLADRFDRLTGFVSDWFDRFRH